MGVQMVHGLASIPALIDDQTITAGEAFLFCDHLCCIQNCQVVARFGELSEARNLSFGHDEHVNGCLGMTVAKGKYVSILIDNFSGNFSIKDFGKYRGHDF